MTPQQDLQRASRLLGERQSAEALVIFERLRTVAPANPFVRLGIATCLVRTGRKDEGKALLAELRAEHHDDAAVLNNLGTISCEAGDVDEGLATLKRGVELHPTDARLREDYVALLSTFDRGLDSHEQAVAALADGVRTARIEAALSATLLQLGRAEEGLPHALETLARYPDNPQPAQWLGVTSLHVESVTPEQNRAHLEAYSQRLCKALRFKPTPRQPRRDDPDRPLRIAFLSGDFHRHSVAYFLLPLVEGLRARGLDLRGYSVGEKRDDMTEAFERAMPLASVPHLPPEGLVRRIKNDKVDVLIELAGMTHNHRHGALLFRPAPVQVTYLGWPGTTGNPSIDYRIVDSRTDPAGAESHCCERLVRLNPCFLCFRPPADAPEPGASAWGSGADAGARPFTLGSFNAQTKISPRVMRAWARILAGAPGSRLLVKNGALFNERVRERVRAWFVEAGADPHRLELLPWSAAREHHLALYDRVDLALDPFPYNGTTTTCEAAHMGVPTLTLAGDRHMARVGVSLLSALGLPEFIAESESAYVQRGIEIARAGPRGLRERLDLRARLGASPLRDEAGFAERFEALVRRMWRESVVR